jgi:hypothetical protein
VTIELFLESSFGSTAADHPIGVDTVHRLASEHAGFAARGAEEGTFAVTADTGGGEIFVEIGFELVVRRHLVALAA